MSNENSIIACQKCGEPLESDWKQCPVCLTPTSSSGLTCPNCQTPVKETWKACPRCSSVLSGTKTPHTAQKPFATDFPSDNEQIYFSMEQTEPARAIGFEIDIPIATGDVLGDRYRIIKRLGKGGFGSVYQVDDMNLNRQIALKVVVAGKGKAQRATEQLIHEFNLRERINDTSHIIKSQDPRSCEYKGLSLVLLPMELADGENLRKWLMQNLDIDTRLKTGIELFKQACLGIKAIHDAGLVHLDIKPENILLVNGTAKIVDFGIGRYGINQFKDNPAQLLRQGIGTPQYMSPEQFQVARQQDIGPASDIYSLGIVLFELLDGNLPFDGTPVELRDKHLNMQAPRLTGKLEGWGRILDRCLAKKSENRYKDIGLFITDIERVARGVTLNIDVSCKCGHINANPDSKICEKCRTSIEAFFRSCPVCAKSVRLDIQICSVCGTAVAAYYLLLDRKKQAEKLKDEDPREAIEILEIIIRDGADDYQEEAVKLIKDLRQKQQQLISLTANANEISASGDTEKALEIWHKVLQLVPRHKLALEQVQKLETLLKGSNEQLKKAVDSMDKAEFENANKLLQKCLELAPKRKDIAVLLETCRERAQKYRIAFEEALVSTKNRLLETANTQIKSALKQAPKSNEALALEAELRKSAEKINTLIHQIKNQLAEAKFCEAKKTIGDAFELQEDNEHLFEIKKESVKTETAYGELWQEATQAKEANDWKKAANKIEEVLVVCPKSSEAKSFLEEIQLLEQQYLAKLKKQKTRKIWKFAATVVISLIVIIPVIHVLWAAWSNQQHLKIARRYLSRGESTGTYDFGRMRLELKTCGWFMASGKSELTQKIDDAEFDWLLKQANHLSQNNQYNEALEALNRASEIKHHPAELKSLIDDLTGKAALQQQRQIEKAASERQRQMEEEQKRIDEASIIKKGWLTSEGSGNDISWDDPPYRYVLSHETGRANGGNSEYSTVSLYERLSNGDLRGLTRKDGRFISAKNGSGGYYIGKLDFSDAPLGTVQSVEVKNNNAKIYELRVSWTKVNRDNYGNLVSAELYYEIRRK